MSVLDATDEQFEAFRLAVGIRVKEGDEGKKWSFDNRCRAINHALKYGKRLPFVEPMTNKKSSEPEQNNAQNNSAEELFDDAQSAPEGVVAIPDAPILSGWATIIKGTLAESKNNDDAR